MEIPDFQSLMLPVLRSSDAGEVHIADVVQRLGEEFSLNTEQLAHLLPSGRQTTFANRVHWAKSYLGKAGLIRLTRRGYFEITPAGQKLLANPPLRIDINFLRQFPEFREFKASVDRETPDQAQVVSASSLTPDEEIRRARDRIEDDLGRVDKRDSQTVHVLIQRCSLGSSDGSRGLVGR